LDLDALFERQQPRVLEIGFGNGESLVAMAAAHVDTDFLGVEVHSPGIGHCLLLLEQLALGNVRVLRGDALDLLRCGFDGPAFQRIQIYFPDPWPKKRHHKRRLVRQDTVDLLTSRLLSGGQLHLATDWQQYAEDMLRLLESSAELRNLAGKNQFSEPRGDRPVTRFERRGRQLGHGVWELLFERT
jgi:tRNA (guanine-N7-)-methyltransferase